MKDDIFSYKALRNDIKMFRTLDPSNPLRKFDEPGTFFWKPVFYFHNGVDLGDSGLGSGGLLHPSWETYDKFNELDDDTNKSGNRGYNECEEFQIDATLNNSAYNYLLRNDEKKRAALLKDFIELLSEISQETPWYFLELSGLDDALSRSEFYKEGKIEDRKKITIKCLADSIDTRIGNMLDMYRAACFSWQTKREIVPANLRKFDMGIYVFLQPYSCVDIATTKITNSVHKYFEFHNCEIDIDSCKIGDSVKNDEGIQIEYSINIYYDNCYDNRYSADVCGYIGDIIITDILTKDPINYYYGKSQFFPDKDYGSKITPNWEISTSSLKKENDLNKIGQYNYTWAANTTRNTRKNLAQKPNIVNTLDKSIKKIVTNTKKTIKNQYITPVKNLVSATAKGINDVAYEAVGNGYINNQIQSFIKTELGGNMFKDTLSDAKSYITTKSRDIVQAIKDATASKSNLGNMHSQKKSTNNVNDVDKNNVVSNASSQSLLNSSLSQEMKDVNIYEKESTSNQNISSNDVDMNDIFPEPHYNENQTLIKGKIFQKQSAINNI